MKKKVIGIVLVGVAILGTAGFLMTNKSQSVEVETIAVQKGNISEYVEELGLVVSENKGSVFAPTAGKVTAVMKDVGDFVDQGEVLVKIDGQQLSRQIMELEAQKSALMAQYNEAVKPIDRKEIEKLELQLNTQKKRVEEARRQNEVNKTLYEAEAISYEEYHVTLTMLQEAEAQLEAINLDLDLIKKPVSENIINSYNAQLKQLDIQMEKLRSQGEDYVVTAPLKGTVMSKFVEAGAYVQPGTQVMEIADGEALYIESDVLVAEIAKIKIGTAVEISHKDLGIEAVKGTVKKIYPQAFSKVSDLGVEQKRIKVAIDLDEKIEGLRPGYDLDLKIIINQKENVLLIPENTVFEKNGKHYVFVSENNIALIKEIQKGIESKRQIEVVSGLHESDLVIVSPDDKLEEGIVLKSDVPTKS
ncbi:efflux RND transporter periplasmic adaptor subunit [Cellulosilyticum sp. I15G10I2]|uniref:efflux RND transporter periplasmic adaptor subunit n=1 Tax=Cellulosilyticum sp. I15G10I2 TaxID=1892843 RepID=UPI00085CBFFA|nr:efflux RND transporter periplasmic adaptor subunit [Cellulosilyticum sp. I15G10I2]